MSFFIMLEFILCERVYCLNDSSKVYQEKWKRLDTWVGRIICLVVMCASHLPWELCISRQKCIKRQLSLLKWYAYNDELVFAIWNEAHTRTGALNGSSSRRSGERCKEQHGQHGRPSTGMERNRSRVSEKSVNGPSLITGTMRPVDTLGINLIFSCLHYARLYAEKAVFALSPQNKLPN